MQDKLNKHFKYNSKNGVIERLTRKNSNGSLDKDGYLIIKFKGKQYKAHRLAWYLHYGKFPSSELDHINQNKLDNRISNLRLADRFINNQNVVKQPNKDTGIIGVYIDKTIGLVAKYATRYRTKVYRFRQLEQAKQFRIKKGLKV